MKRVWRILAMLLVIYLAFALLVFFCQRSLLYFPSHHAPSGRLAPWRDGNRTLGYCRTVPNARVVWLMLHGNAGQASDRDYALNRVSDHDSFYVLEYPGYGAREGSPCLQSFNQAASEGYRILRSQNSGTPICVLGESIGSGPACSLAQEPTPPEKIVLVVPFDSLANVAAERFSVLPVRYMLRDAWNNVEALKHYAGPVDIFAATDDTIIPIAHARSLASQTPSAHLTPIAGGHNDWSFSDEVKISR